MSAATIDLPAQASRDQARPELGALIATLAMMMAEQRAVVLHVTSSRHGEGTTTVARELAAAAARAPWCRVALLDAAPASMDFTLPSLLGAFERGHEPTLRQARLGGAEIAVGRLAGLGEGTPRLETLRGLFAWTRSQFALVVVDSPPVLPCREAAIAAAVADATLLVVQAETSRRSEIVQARQILDQLGAKMLGVVLNKRRRRVPRFVERLL